MSLRLNLPKVGEAGPPKAIPASQRCLQPSRTEETTKVKALRKYISIERMLYVARCVVPSRLLRDRLSDETKANVWPETLDPRERKDHLVAEKMSLQYIEFSFKMFNLLSVLPVFIILN